MLNFLYLVNPNKPLNKQSSCRWLTETLTWHHCNFFLVLSDISLSVFRILYNMMLLLLWLEAKNCILKHSLWRKTNDKYLSQFYITSDHDYWSLFCNIILSLHWRHNGHDGVSNHQPYGCLLNRLFRRRSKKTSKLRVTGLCAGNSPGPANSSHKGPVTRKIFPFDDVIMVLYLSQFHITNDHGYWSLFCDVILHHSYFSSI